ncbi:MAG: tRNA (guanine(10)-N(2))-dimethyltransferase [Candidatus Hydrothermarchaeota archaeon]|nr:MAG: tRNA (guanine(10)-N(2))-dimethyltransferase [Candidatus Hydrothermarchaeota archaeon]
MLIKEGDIEVFVDEGVFYNPRMKLNRDITCLVVKVLAKEKRIKFLDLLSASGIKGLRVAKECDVEVCLNDVSKKAYENIKKNAKSNKLSVDITNKDANLLLQERRGYFNFIDIDPFGTPIPFLDNAIMHIKNGYLGVTATDTAPLCGVYPEVCFRKYSALPLKTEFCHELGLRILLGYIARTVAKYSKGMRCIFSHSTEHYFRTYLEIEKGKAKASETLSNLGYLYYCRKCMNRVIEKSLLPETKFCECGEKFSISGILWFGKIKNDKLCDEILKIKEEKLVKTIREELHTPFYYDLHRICKKLKICVPKINNIIERLKSMGYNATRTHFSPTGIKTDAKIKTIKGLLLCNTHKSH